MLLDRALGDPQPVGDARVRAALRHEREHLAFPLRDLLQGSSRRRAAMSSCTSAGSTTEPPVAIRPTVSANSATSVTRPLSR